MKASLRQQLQQLGYTKFDYASLKETCLPNLTCDNLTAAGCRRGEGLDDALARLLIYINERA